MDYRTTLGGNRHRLRCASQKVESTRSQILDSIARRKAEGGTEQACDRDQSLSKHIARIGSCSARRLLLFPLLPLLASNTTRLFQSDNEKFEVGFERSERLQDLHKEFVLLLFISFNFFSTKKDNYGVCKEGGGEKTPRAGRPGAGGRPKESVRAIGGGRFAVSGEAGAGAGEEEEEEEEAEEEEEEAAVRVGGGSREIGIGDPGEIGATFGVARLGGAAVFCGEIEDDELLESSGKISE